MNGEIVSAKDRGKKIMLLFLAMLLFKFSLDLSYWLVLGRLDPHIYTADFSPLKYALGLIWCVVLFFGINHKKKDRASTFLLYLVYLLQIIPITTIYALGNDNSEYYNILCIAFLCCEMIVGHTNDRVILQRNGFISNVMCIGFAAAALMVVAYIVLTQGVPSLAALDIYDVYDLRASGSFQLNKYLNYIFEWMMKVLLPMAIAYSLVKKRYLTSILLCGVVFLMYLYSGHKTYLFCIPLVFVCTIWAKRKNFYWEFFTVAPGGMAALSLLLCVFPEEGTLLSNVYSLFIRRCLLVPANNKFNYFDYFSTRPKMGLGGIFPRWLINIPNYYENIPYSYEISEIYYGKPEMNSNTGFLAEGYARFGHFGTLLILVLFALILRQVDKMQDRTSFALTVGIFIYPVFTLADGYLMHSFVLGSWMILMLILLCYTRREKSGLKYSALSRERSPIK